jgi:hypothetical protein
MSICIATDGPDLVTPPTCAYIKLSSDELSVPKGWQHYMPLSEHAMEYGTSTPGHHTVSAWLIDGYDRNVSNCAVSYFESTHAVPEWSNTCSAERAGTCTAPPSEPKEEGGQDGPPQLAPRDPPTPSQLASAAASAAVVARLDGPPESVIAFAGGHDSNIAVTVNGSLVLALELERLFEKRCVEYKSIEHAPAQDGPMAVPPHPSQWSQPMRGATLLLSTSLTPTLNLTLTTRATDTWEGLARRVKWRRCA